VKKRFFKFSKSVRDMKNINWLSYLFEKPLKEIEKIVFNSEFLKKLCKNKNIKYYYEC